MKKIALAASVVALHISALHATASAATLYQWTGEDGTPTYSVEPPPRGIPFVVIGPDLKPAANQGAATAPTAVAKTAPAAAPKPAQPTTADTPVVPSNFSKPTGVVIAPTPGGVDQKPNKPVIQPAAAKPAPPKTKWKPVVYADDPNPQRQAKPTAITPEPVAANDNNGLITSECMQVRKHLVMLEGLFANASTPESMDKAVVELSRFKRNNAKTCNLR